jgi:hypothetical protein
MSIVAGNIGGSIGQMMIKFYIDNVSYPQIHALPYPVLLHTLHELVDVICNDKFTLKSHFGVS